MPLITNFCFQVFIIFQSTYLHNQRVEILSIQQVTFFDNTRNTYLCKYFMGARSYPPNLNLGKETVAVRYIKVFSNYGIIIVSLRGHNCSTFSALLKKNYHIF